MLPANCQSFEEESMKQKTLAILALGLNFSSIYAQTQGQVLDSQNPINVDGYLQEERSVSDSELENLKSTVKKYKNENNLYKEKTKVLNKVTTEAEKIGENAEEKIHAQVEAKRAENKAMEKIKKAEEKLKCLMENNSPEDCQQFQDEIQTQQAAPAPVEAQAVSEVEVAPEVKKGGSFETVKILPYVGGTTYNSRSENLEAELSGGLRLESNINERFSMGVGFNYAQLSTNDFANNSSYMTPSYMGFFGSQGREIQFRTMGIDLYGKFFITNGERFRPYVGAGLGYNRASLKYTQNNQFVSPTFGSFGNEEYRNSYAQGSVALGSEIMITKNVGINLEGAYSTGLGNSLSSRNTQTLFNSPDQRRLNDLGDEIIDAHALSIFASMLVTF